MHKRMVCGVLVDDTELYEQIEYWKNKYEERCEEGIKVRNSIKCDKCNGDMKYIGRLNTWVCLTCGNMR